VNRHRGSLAPGLHRGRLWFLASTGMRIRRPEESGEGTEASAHGSEAQELLEYFLGRSTRASAVDNTSAHKPRVTAATSHVADEPAEEHHPGRQAEAGGRGHQAERAEAAFSRKPWPRAAAPWAAPPSTA
jgi:hypothetical protein